MIPPFTKEQLRQVEDATAAADKLPKDLNTAVSEIARNGHLGLAAALAESPATALGFTQGGAIERALETLDSWKSVTSDDFSAADAVTRAVRDAGSYLPSRLASSGDIGLAQQLHADIYQPPAEIILRDLDGVTEMARRVIDSQSSTLEQLRLTINSFADSQVDQLVGLATASLTNTIALRSWSIPVQSGSANSVEKTEFEQEIQVAFPDTSAEVVSVYARIREMVPSLKIGDMLTVIVIFLMLETRFNTQHSTTQADVRTDEQVNVNLEIETPETLPLALEDRTARIECLLSEIRDAVVSQLAEQTEDHDGADRDELPPSTSATASTVQRSLEQDWYAYEALWQEPGTSFKSLARDFAKHPELALIDRVDPHFIAQSKEAVDALIAKADIGAFQVKLEGNVDYPSQLADAEFPVHLLYVQGDAALMHVPARVALIGSRKVSISGLSRARRLARLLAEAGVTVVSGLAEGVDTMAHTAAIEAGGRTLAVIGTPITDCYPKSNRALQRKIATEHCLVSQIPIWLYSTQDYRMNRHFFPERNATMSALSDATVIIEAQDRSGTLTQAKAALKQGRPLYILASCFDDPSLSWPAKYESLGAQRLDSIDPILSQLYRLGSVDTSQDKDPTCR